MSLPSGDRPWIEAYRPNLLDNIILPQMERKILDSILKDAASHSSSTPDSNRTNMPNLMLVGPTGIGKTSVTLCIARQVLGSRFSQGMLMLDCSDDRGITAVESLEAFCKKSSSYTNVDGKTCTSPKIIIFDEADRITDKAQMAIGELMNTYPDVTFTFTCNDSTFVVEGIQSKCVILRLQPIARNMMSERLIQICDSHGAKWSQTGIDEAVIDSNGDMRRAINIAQSVWSGFGEITEETIRKLHPRPATSILRQILELCSKGELGAALKIVHRMIGDGTSAQDIMSGMQTFLKIDTEFDDKYRMRCTTVLGKSMLVAHSHQTQLQLDACIAGMCAEALKVE